MASLIGIHDRLHDDLVYARNEVAWGQLTALDLKEIFALLRSLMLPLAGISMLPDIFQALNEHRKTSREGLEDRQSSMEKDLEILRQSLLAKPNTSSELVMAGIQHSLIVLDIAPAKKPKRRLTLSRASNDVDTEEAGDVVVPGRSDFASYLQEQVHKFCSRRGDAQASLPAFAMTESQQNVEDMPEPNALETNEDSFIFSIEYLLGSLLQATLELVKFADSKTHSGNKKHKRLIIPRRRFIKSWLSLGDGTERSESESMRCANDSDSRSDTNHPVDPEHLPPVNSFCWNTMYLVHEGIQKDQGSRIR
jgi:hypothetical protein